MAEPLTVVDWIDDDEVTEDTKCSLGGMGGWFDRGNTWDDYLKESGESVPHSIALRDEVIKHRIIEGGDWHQHHGGTPVFSDGTVAQFTYRAWGDFMAATWNHATGLPFCYMDFYMSRHGDAKERIAKFYEGKKDD